MPNRPIVFFVHHQGRGHANRTMAIVRELPPDRPVTVLTAGPHLFDGFERPVDIVPLPNMIGARVRSAALFAEATPAVMHCVPLGVPAVRATMRTIVDTLDALDPALFVIDVSAEIALLSRICSVPAIKIRMHGERLDPGHDGAYQACVNMLAPFDPVLEQPDYPDWARTKTFYSGGLCTTRDPVPTRAEARAALGLDPDRQVILVLSGQGGSGTPLAPLTVGARAIPEALWIVLGPVHREGHETDFGNLVEKGWVPDVTRHIAAADLVFASAGDNTVHEIARVGRPFVCVPEWRYFGEQTCKAERLAAVGAAVFAPHWPGSLAPWRELAGAATALDPAAQRALYAPGAAAAAAAFLEERCRTLWD